MEVVMIYGLYEFIFDGFRLWSIDMNVELDEW